MEKTLRNQVALVTGASSGIGRGSALALARAGAAVAVNYLSSPDDAKAVVAEIERAGGRAIALQADVSREPEVERLFAEAIARFGTVDILVANAGIQKDAPFKDLSLADWQKVIDVNLTGYFLCARAAVREFLRRGLKPEVSRAAGKIIFVSSVHEIIPWAGHVNYAASKGGISLLMKSLAQEVLGQKIRVNSVAPGAIRTEINRPAWESEKAMRGLLEFIPYGRIGEPDDVGRAVAWLASDESDYVAGTTLFIDGGMTLYPEFRHGG
ncbi:MAG TPA: glucose 1-dehydrogenase [Burkholderiales bacterium]|nr:glucose 1-dehydrogenase [Burkholderiales bacterium]